MPSWFRKQSDTKPTIAALRFDTADWKYHPEKEADHLRVWETSEHDAISLHFFDQPPDITACATFGALEDFYHAGVKSAGAEIVECVLEPAAGCSAIRLLMKAPQPPSGFFYQGVLTLPFRDFSYVVKIQCRENGITGVREAVLLDKRLAKGETPSTTGKGPPFADWNPDSPEHDAQFPAHPISRVRRLLQHVQKTATLDEAIARMPPFSLPGDPSMKRGTP